ncbi:MAG: hypothetical protein HFJ07_09000 [Lachnospiraceae bacterium]|jgi:Transcriptional regulators|nr:hypothetical protein [Lachnospiraceae bacterium]
MERVIILDSNVKNIGLYTRTVTEGVELELVKAFIEFYIHDFLKKNKVNNLAVFVEPQIASGFPDIVFASYSAKILDDWSDERERLDINDFKVLSHLIMVAGCSGEHLAEQLGLSEKIVLRALENLMDAKMIRRSRGVWKPVDLKKIYHIKKLVSVEAKMSDIKKVAEQSLINTWFASQSYALVNTASPQNSTITSFEKQGTGLYCKRRGFKKVVEAQRLKLPSSYLSLQFNEWIGKVAAHQH